MTINLSLPQHGTVLQPRITVIGVGGAGGNAVNNMIDSRLEGVDFLVANTDSQALAQSLSERKIQLGHNITHGLGAGARPDIGRASAEEAIDELVEHLQAAHMVFVTAGMGGGTGTGAAPVIARLAREHGILTVGVVTKPFQFEGISRMRIAEAGIEEMQQYVDTLIVIPNQNLFRVANEKTTFAEAFTMADEVLHCGVRGVTDLMVVPGLINLDFADIRTVMAEMGKAMMGTGEAEGEDRARIAAESAISNPLLDEVSMKGARGVLINITGGPDMTLFEVDEAANRIGDEVDSEANIIFGSTVDPTLEGRLRVSVVATGIEAEAERRPRPVLKVYTSVEGGGGQVGETADPPGNAPAAEISRNAAIAESPAEAFSVAEPRFEAVAAGAISAGAAPFRIESTAQAPDSRPGAASEQPVPAGIPRPSADRPQPAPKAPAAPATRDAFIPPPAVDPHRTSEPAGKPDPFREAEMINGASPAPQRKRGPSLFQRMTGTGRARKNEAEAKPEVETVKAPEAPEAAVVDTPEPAPPPVPRQTRLEGMDLRDRSQPVQSEEDLLDIPAFLRRQAN